jgi:DNA phosphorothioation-dependent restriction protein DptG
MTHATKAIFKLLLTNYVKVSKVSVEDMMFDEKDINRSMDKIEVCVYEFLHSFVYIYPQPFCSPRNLIHFVYLPSKQ